MQNIINATEGHCIMNRDTDTKFLKDMSKKEMKHESNKSMV